MLRPYRFDLGEAVSLFASLLSLSLPDERYPPLMLSPQRRRERTLEIMMSMLLQLAEQQPLLFVLEDLHWTDPTTLELINLLIDQVPAASLCLLLTCRPMFQPGWEHRSYITELTISQLNPRQVQVIVERITAGKHLPEQVLAQIIEKTDGVPLFVEELTKTILESGYLQVVEGEDELVGSVPALAIPATLQDSLMARLDRLMTAKGIAQLGAVIGRQFSYELLRLVSQLDDVTLRRELGRLVEGELVYQRGLPPEATYTYKHALIRDTAYTSLLRTTRQQYHRAVAKALEERFSQTTADQPELLAHHYTESGDMEQAVAYWQKASEQATQRSAHAEAISHAKRGLEVIASLPNNPPRAQHELALHISLGAVLLSTKGYADPEVEQTYARAFQLCQQVGDGVQRARILIGLHSYRMLRGDLGAAYELSVEALELARIQDDTALLIQAHQAMAHSLFSQGKLATARQHVEQGLTLYNPCEHRTWAFRSGMGDLQALCLCRLAWILMPLGYVDQAVARINEAIAIARQFDHPFSLANALAYATWVYRQRDEPHRVQELAEEALALAQTYGFAFQWARSIYIQGWARAMQGDFSGGLEQMHEGLSAMLKTGTSYGQPQWLMGLAAAYARQGDVEHAYHYITEALRASDRLDLSITRPPLNCLLAEILLQQGGDAKAQEAEAHLFQAVTIARQQEAKLYELEAVIGLVRLWQSQGKRQDAYNLLAPVYGWFTEGFDIPSLQQAKAFLVALDE